ncbi:MAG: glycoside hydrolase family 92 protein, partial [Bacteroidales bacterium]|nr:glycoside hydrolase family 92 protein [Bacteroidales bacterium]
MKRMLKIVLKGFLYLLVAGLVFVSWFRLKYEIIVHTRPLPENRWASPGYPLIRTVDPFIGTGGYPWTCAHNFPGATLPFSMVRLGPETASILTHKRALNTSGYFYGDNKICGFSHTRLIGTGATDGGHFLVTPAIGHISHNRLRKGFYIPFSHRDETAFPGYYSVYLRKKKILAEMTVTPHTGIHRYTFKGWREPHLVINAGNTLGDYTADNGHVAVLPEKQEVEGSIRTFGTFAQRYGGVTVYFVARFNKPFQSFTTWNEQGLFSGRDTISGHHPGVILDFAETIPDNRIVLKMGISYVSVDNARQNLNTEAGDKSFDEILETARQAWMKKLSLIDIEGATDTQRTIFYTALYRA